MELRNEPLVNELNGEPLRAPEGDIEVPLENDSKDKKDIAPYLEAKFSQIFSGKSCEHPDNKEASGPSTASDQPAP